jgi:nucleotide-binding universal stress UspA family protein
VLRDTPVPVLVTPGHQRPTGGLSEIAGQIGRVIAPVDLTESSRHQLVVAGGIAGGLSVPLIVANVLEPVFIAHDVRLAVSAAEGARRAHVEERLAEIVASFAPPIRAESIVLTGEPTEEIIKLAEVRQANLIVMGLHSSGLLGPRMGSVTYRVLCLTHALVLAIPPTVAAKAPARSADASSD